MRVQCTIYNKVYTFKVVKKNNTLCNYSKKRKYSTLHNANYTLRNDSTSAMTVIHCTITVQWISQYHSLTQSAITLVNAIFFTAGFIVYNWSTRPINRDLYSGIFIRIPRMRNKKSSKKTKFINFMFHFKNLSIS